MLIGSLLREFNGVGGKIGEHLRDTVPVGLYATGGKGLVLLLFEYFLLHR